MVTNAEIRRYVNSDISEPSLLAKLAIISLISNNLLLSSPLFPSNLLSSSLLTYLIFAAPTIISMKSISLYQCQKISIKIKYLLENLKLNYIFAKQMNFRILRFGQLPIITVSRAQAREPIRAQAREPLNPI